MLVIPPNCLVIRTHYSIIKYITNNSFSYMMNYMRIFIIMPFFINILIVV